MWHFYPSVTISIPLSWDTGNVVWLFLTRHKMHIVILVWYDSLHTLTRTLYSQMHLRSGVGMSSDLPFMAKSRERVTWTTNAAKHIAQKLETFIDFCYWWSSSHDHRDIMNCGLKRSHLFLLMAWDKGNVDHWPPKQRPLQVTRCGNWT
jgi:hypothetical protein